MIYGWYFDSYQNTYHDYPSHSLIISDALITLNSLYGIILTVIFYSCTRDATVEYINIFNNMKKVLITFYDKNHDSEATSDSPYFKM